MNYHLKQISLCISIFLINIISSYASEYRFSDSYISKQYINGGFKIADYNKSAPIFIDNDEWEGVIIAAENLSSDIFKVTGKKPDFNNLEKLQNNKGIIIGTIGKSNLIDSLISINEIDITSIENKWESYIIKTIGENLFVIGSDKRGTIYGIYDISEKIGVSPWYFWADVPVKKSSELYVIPGEYITESPKVKYRGIFINDEWPSFGGWCSSKYGGFNSGMYATIFELLLRLKANYLWPAMWSAAFNEDDSLNPEIADKYGIVMGTSHHEPMMRAHKEYSKRKELIGPWNYQTNKENLDNFFFEGLNRNKNYENLITIGMRGDGDVAMSEEGDAENMKILTNVINGQRDIISQVYNKKASEVPQVWAIFTEVQRYYDAGFNVPDDVLLMFCDNNWGYIRRIAPPQEHGRSGGCGLYYHIDMNGGPWNDRWINTTTIPKLREQFNLAYKSGLDALWVVNVGDLKPKELPIDFIMRYAWNPDKISPNDTDNYTYNWARETFGDKYAEEIAYIVSKYPKYNLWRKPEVQAVNIFSNVNYNEADSIFNLWTDLEEKVESLKSKIDTEYQDAFYQLVYYPAKASAGVAKIYLLAGKNNLYAIQGRLSANKLADLTEELFIKDKELSDYYNNEMSAGKWKNMMSDKHIGYTEWFMPNENILPELIRIDTLNTPTMGLCIEGSELSWPDSKEKAKLPDFNNLTNQTYYIDLYNKGIDSFDYKIKTSANWIKINNNKGSVTSENRLWVNIDWSKIKKERSEGTITIIQGRNKFNIDIKAIKKDLPKCNDFFFGGINNEFSIPANKYNKNIEGRYTQWIEIPDLGRGNSCMGAKDVTSLSTSMDKAAILEYNVYFDEPGIKTICLGILPTQDVYPQRGLRIGIGLGNNKAESLDARVGFVDTFNEYTPESLQLSKFLKPLPKINNNLSLISHHKHRRNEIFDNIRWIDTQVEVSEPGIHKLKIYMVDPEIILEKIIINPDNRYPSYFGAPYIIHNNTNLN